MEQRDNETYFKNELSNLLYPNINESKDIINESIVLDILGWVKTALTSHRVGELMTSLVKIIYKWIGVDKNGDGVKDKCEAIQDEEEKVECGKMGIQRLSEWLHEQHDKIMKPLRFLAAALKFKTLKPSKEQKEEAKGLGKKFFQGIIAGCLVYYMSKMGIEASEGHYAMATVYFGGGMVKLTELIKKWDSTIHDINSAVPS
jgi:hypothetical protein